MIGVCSSGVSFMLCSIRIVSDFASCVVSSVTVGPFCGCSVGLCGVREFVSC